MPYNPDFDVEDRRDLHHDGDEGLLRADPESEFVRGRPRMLFVVWKAYQRRSDVLAPLLGAELLYIPHRFKGKTLRPFDYGLKLLQTVAHIYRTRPDYVVVQSPPHFAALPALLTRVPYIIDAHNGLFQSYWRRVPLLETIVRRARGLITHNEEIRCVAEQQHPGATFFTIRDPLVPIHPPHHVVRHESRILFICSFAGDEPLEVIVDVIERLPETEFVITADPRKLPRALRERFRACANLTLTGYLDTEAYHELLCSSAAAIVLTTNAAVQQSGACEALCSDTPLITSRSSLTESLFGEWATLVDNEAEAIVCAIRSLDHRPLDLSAYRALWSQSLSAGIRQLYADLEVR